MNLRVAHLLGNQTMFEGPIVITLILYNRGILYFLLERFSLSPPSGFLSYTFLYKPTIRSISFERTTSISIFVVLEILVILSKPHPIKPPSYCQTLIPLIIPDLVTSPLLRE